MRELFVAADSGGREEGGEARFDFDAAGVAEAAREAFFRVETKPNVL